MDENPDERHRGAWERFMAAERREVEQRRNGHLSRALGASLPGETEAELARIGEEDRELAERGLVEMMDARGDTYHKHVDELQPGDRADRIRAQGARVRWLTERARKPRGLP